MIFKPLFPLIHVEGTDQHAPLVKYKSCPFISTFSNSLIFVQKKGKFLKLWCSSSLSLNSSFNLVTFLVRKTEYEIKKIIEIFFNTLCELKLIFFSIRNANGKDINENTMIYPAYLKLEN